jgi:CBS domain-containing protein
MRRKEHVKMKERKAADIMTTPVVTVTKDTVLTDAIRLLLRWHISGMPVVDERGKLIGILSEHDIMNFAFSGDAADTKVEEAMS